MDLIATYDSSDGSENEHELIPTRKLPKPSVSLIPNQPTANPLLHQGRIRSTPHVEGQFASFVYISVHIDVNLQRFLEEIALYAMERVPTLQSVWLGGTTSSDRELHISLTRPIYLFHHQRDEFIRAVKATADSISEFNGSFATFATFNNDERSRSFVGLEIGAGHEILRDISKSLEKALQFLRQEVYYLEPRFHASFSWALLETNDERGEELRDLYPTILELPSTLVPDLTSNYGDKLTGKVGTFHVDSLHCKIGKQVHRFPLE
ncbi:hypothetical protein SCHPADRAFT_922568 [Schizopora paradoxa]|uniref:U6 snRNA phosphodiesterase 1 n=1 Tax=Schizopora paradoxa TaxID=27342 RepID=A0A0H2RB84_9AGAM|nr:hypothetical protein SCHPADRAFT_922568 [Schizopora paradoxa]